jgi:hypothetical protein
VAFEPVSGHLAKCTIKKADPAPNIELPGFNWNLDIDGNAKPVDNWRDGVRTKTTMEVATGKLQIVWDSDAPPHLEANGEIRNGTELDLLLYTDEEATENKAYLVQVKITKVALSNQSTKDELVYDAEWRQHGDLTYPTA